MTNPELTTRILLPRRVMRPPSLSAAGEHESRPQLHLPGAGLQPRGHVGAQRGHGRVLGAGPAAGLPPRERHRERARPRRPARLLGGKGVRVQRWIRPKLSRATILYGFSCFFLVSIRINVTPFKAQGLRSESITRVQVHSRTSQNPTGNGARGPQRPRLPVQSVLARS